VPADTNMMHHGGCLIGGICNIVEYARQVWGVTAKIAVGYCPVQYVGTGMKLKG
jgi:hypothetical protein